MDRKCVICCSTAGGSRVAMVVLSMPLLVVTVVERANAGGIYHDVVVGDEIRSRDGVNDT